MNIEQAKAIPISKILEKLGRTPTRQSGKQSWFIAPWRDENTASLHVHEGNNWWFDFGIGFGGNSISLVIHHLKNSRESHTISDALRWLKNMVRDAPIIENQFISKCEKRRAQRLKLISAKPIQHPALIKFLEKRGIPLTVAKQILKEVRAHNFETNKTFFALGLQNEELGFEIRNPHIKSSVGKKAITFIRGSEHNREAIHIFEGFMDYLSIITQNNGKKLKDDAIVLNSVSFANQATSYIKGFGYSKTFTWLDNDDAGKNATNIFHTFSQTERGMIHKAMNDSYLPFKDVNAKHMASLGL